MPRSGGILGNDTLLIQSLIHLGSSLHQDILFMTQHHKMTFKCFVKLFVSLDLIKTRVVRYVLYIERYLKSIDSNSEILQIPSSYSHEVFVPIYKIKFQKIIFFSPNFLIFLPISDTSYVPLYIS